MTRKVGGAGVRRRPRTRSGRDVIDPGRIADAGLAALRADGARAVTMARVSRDLGVTPRAVYHWVPSRRALLALVTERAQSTLPLPVASGDWRGDLRRYRDDIWTWLDRYPGVEDIALGEGVHVVGERVMAAQEAGLALLCEAGLAPRTALLVLGEFSRWVGGTHRYLTASGADESFVEVVSAGHASASADSTRYPNAAAAGRPDAAEQIEFGFELFLTSVAGLLDEARADR